MVGFENAAKASAKLYIEHSRASSLIVFICFYVHIPINLNVYFYITFDYKQMLYTIWVSISSDMFQNYLSMEHDFCQPETL